MAFIPPQEHFSQMEYAVGVVRAQENGSEQYGRAIVVLGHMVRKFASQLIFDTERRSELLPFGRDMVMHHLGNKEFAFQSLPDTIITVVWSMGTVLIHTPAGPERFASETCAKRAYESVGYACEMWRNPKALPATERSSTVRSRPPSIFLATAEHGLLVHKDLKDSA